MSDTMEISKKSLLLVGVGFVVVAFVGVLLGHWFVGWRQARAQEDMFMSYSPDRMGLLHKGDVLPNVALMDEAGNTVDVHDIVMGQATLVMFMSPGCEPCLTASEHWGQFADKLPPDLQIIGVCNGGIESAEAYHKETAYPYPLYCDSAYSFALKYDITKYPSVIGLTASGRMAFVGLGVYEGFTPLMARDMITREEMEDTEGREGRTGMGE